VRCNNRYGCIAVDGSFVVGSGRRSISFLMIHVYNCFYLYHDAYTYEGTKVHYVNNVRDESRRSHRAVVPRTGMDIYGREPMYNTHRWITMEWHVHAADFIRDG
jgi:hypothetical protein